MMRSPTTLRRLLPLLCAATAVFFFSCGPEKTQFARIHTRMGDIRIRLFNTTPRHRDNFIRLAQAGFYDSLLFHRVLRDAFIQGGDPESRHVPAGVLLGRGGAGYTLNAEIDAPLLRGALVAAQNAGADEMLLRSNGAQFFIVQGALQTDATLDAREKQLKRPYTPYERTQYKESGGLPELDGLYTVFGAVVEGMKVVDRIAAVPRDANDRPLQDIRMRITIE